MDGSKTELKLGLELSRLFFSCGLKDANDGDWACQILQMIDEFNFIFLFSIVVSYTLIPRLLLRFD